ncbi:MAG: heat-shock protein HtpX [Candidatus Micrarchaeota archaeon]|nr:MAG: heat-shock protein HtpX [Candidatus Micrarchaeota archaeon]
MVSNYIGFKLKMYLGFLVFGVIFITILFTIEHILYRYVSYAFLIFNIVILLLFTIAQWLAAPYIISAASRLREITDDKSYADIVSIAKRVAKMNNIEDLRVYIADVDFPNAFAFGNILSGNRVAITKPLLYMLKDNEIEAVLGHEVGHLRNRDVELMLALSLIPSFVYYIALSLLFSDYRYNYQLVLGFALIVVSFLLNIPLLYVNRLRESYEDLNSVKTVKDPDGLEMALAKIELYVNKGRSSSDRDYAIRSLTNMLMFNGDKESDESEIRDPRDLIEYWKQYKVRFHEDLFDDHPHPARRIQLIENAKRDLPKR